MKLVESAAPAVTRRGQSFADAAFDGAATLAGVSCLRKRVVLEDQRGLAPLVIGLGPNFVAGGHATDSAPVSAA